MLFRSGEPPELPAIEIEAYFCSSDEDEVTVKKFRGTNNSLHEDVEGVKLEVVFDTNTLPHTSNSYLIAKSRIFPLNTIR